MIFSEKEEQPLRFDSPDQVDLLDKILFEKVKLLNEDGLLTFVVPNKFLSNTEKTIYKCGFLVLFLKKLYPDKNMIFISQMINKRYQVFIGDRQIERNLKKFQEDIDFYIY